MYKRSVNHPLQLSSWRLRTPPVGPLRSRPLPGNGQVVPAEVQARPGGRLHAKPLEGPLEARSGDEASQASDFCNLREHGVGRESTQNHTGPLPSPGQRGAGASQASGWGLLFTPGLPGAWPAQPAPAPSLTCKPRSAGSFCSRHKGVLFRLHPCEKLRAGSHDQSRRKKKATARPRDQPGRMGGAARETLEPTCARAQRRRLRFLEIKENPFRLWQGWLNTLLVLQWRCIRKSQSNLAPLFRAVLNFLCTLRMRNKGNYIWKANWFGKYPNLEGQFASYRARGSS